METVGTKRGAKGKIFFSIYINHTHCHFVTEKMKFFQNAPSRRIGQGLAPAGSLPPRGRWHAKRDGRSLRTIRVCTIFQEARSPSVSYADSSLPEGAFANPFRFFFLSGGNRGSLRPETHPFFRGRRRTPVPTL